MSIAQQPRRVGDVKPRRNTAQDGASDYDSQEVPVLLRLPARACQSPAGELSSHGSATGGEATGLKTEPNRQESKLPRGRRSANKADRGIDTKLIVGGLVVGVVIAGMLFFTNGRSTDQSDDLAWPQENGEELAAGEDLQVIIPEVSEATPEFAYGLETDESQPIAREPLDSLTAPDLADVPGPGGLPRDTTLEDSTAINAQTSWNEEPSTRLYPSGGANNAAKRVNNWPAGDFTDNASGTDNRSSMNGTDNSVYRTGRLEQDTAPSGNILDGTIEIPTPTSRR